jgi:hypothetical protein
LVYTLDGREAVLDCFSNTPGQSFDVKDPQHCYAAPLDQYYALRARLYFTDATGANHRGSS